MFFVHCADCTCRAFRDAFAVARSRSNVRSDRGRRPRGKRFWRFMTEPSPVVCFDPSLGYKLRHASMYFAF
jgi:hypothetical protein